MGHGKGNEYAPLTQDKGVTGLSCPEQRCPLTPMVCRTRNYKGGRKLQRGASLGERDPHISQTLI